MEKEKSKIGCIPNCVFTYQEPRVNRIRSGCLATINWLLLVVVTAVIAGYFLGYKKGYQDIVPVESAVTTKLYGVDDTNTSDQTIWDNADYMIPPKENGAFTVITSVLVTRKQTQSLCDEDPSVLAGRCRVDSDCHKHMPVRYGNGIMTGKCIKSTHAVDVKVCQIKAWCPVEIDDPSKRAYLDSDQFTVFIKNNVRFPDLGKNRQNIPDGMGSEELATCLFDPKDPRNKHCPVFQINTIVEETGNSFKSIAIEGCVIEIVISWDCNFDLPRRECLPKYSFYRLDRREHMPSRGFHMRFADKYVNKNGLNERTLYKAYGIRAVVSVQGRGRQFGIIVTGMTIGSGLSYFGIVTVVISKILLPFYLKRRSRPSICEGTSTNCFKGKLQCSLQPFRSCTNWCTRKLLYGLQKCWSWLCGFYTQCCLQPFRSCTNCGPRKLLDGLQKFCSLLCGFYTLNKTAEGDDLRAVHFDFKCETHSKEEREKGTVSDTVCLIEADPSEEPDLGGNSSSDPTGASVSYRPDTGVTMPPSLKLYPDLPEEALNIEQE